MKIGQKEFDLKKAGALAILVPIFTGLIAFADPLFKFSIAIFTFGSKYENINATIADTKLKLIEHERQIKTNHSHVKDFRSVWCLDRITSSKKIDPYVLKTCTGWIKE